MNFSPVTSLSRLCAFAGAVFITLVTVVSMALIGHPPQDSGAVLAQSKSKSKAAMPALQASTTVAHR
ncbi:hypothetical protein [Caenimonas koreensis]|uniref:Uncharacterized protein n=1 Tax=Caenimonas koreensis DSM 17982 TaxID=1121255 RepID=A0A844BCS0_9BURK|nr:hypothetical protein [Caenimonas koreensis]MRD49247.1 hypothetical protein [Caenimonas koreensis DSM 17982]